VLVEAISLNTWLMLRSACNGLPNLCQLVNIEEPLLTIQMVQSMLKQHNWLVSCVQNVDYVYCFSFNVILLYFEHIKQVSLTHYYMTFVLFGEQL